MTQELKGEPAPGDDMDLFPNCWLHLISSDMSMCQRLYSGIPKRELPQGGESLARTVDRIVPYWRRRSLIAKLVMASMGTQLY